MFVVGSIVFLPPYAIIPNHLKCSYTASQRKVQSALIYFKEFDTVKLHRVSILGGIPQKTELCILEQLRKVRGETGRGAGTQT